MSRIETGMALAAAALVLTACGPSINVSSDWSPEVAWESFYTYGWLPDAQNDGSGSARVSAATALTDLVERAEDRASGAEYDLMQDQSTEIKTILEDIRSKQLLLPSPSQSGFD